MRGTNFGLGLEAHCYARGHVEAIAESQRSRVWRGKFYTGTYVPQVQNDIQAKTDHMLVMNYDPITGWSAPEIKPYGPLSFDPMASCFHYCPNVFEGMKACSIFVSRMLVALIAPRML